MPKATIKRAIRRATGAQRVGDGEVIQSLWDGYGEVLKFELEGLDVPSVIVKSVVPPGATKRGRARDLTRERKLRSYKVEAHFYETYSQRAAPHARLPEAHCCQTTADGFLFVLEDLDVVGFSERRHELSDTEVRACLTWLAKFHAVFLGTPPEGLWKSGTYWHLATRTEELRRMTEPTLKRAAQGLSSRLSRCRYKTLVHGDAKPANFCFSSNCESVAAVDFQYVGAGSGVQDVAYLLDCCVPACAAEGQIPAYLDHYFAALRVAAAELQPTVSGADVESDWRRLFPVAWADFARFLDGWAPGKYPPGEYSRALIAQAVGECPSG